MEKRRRALRSDAEVQVKAALAAALLGLAGQGVACELPAGGNIVDAPRYSLVYRTQPARLSVGEHFALDFSICAKEGRPAPHRHGMNYRAEVSALGGGKFRAVGLMFHMPGLWQLLFDIDGERIADNLPIE